MSNSITSDISAFSFCHSSELKETGTNSYEFIVSPLPPGFGYAYGPSLRRLLYSSIPAYAITALSVPGTLHEFSGIEGVLQDLSEVILNLKMVIIKSTNTDAFKATIKLNKTGEVFARDINFPSGTEAVNGDLLLMTVTADIDLEIELDISRGMSALQRQAGESTSITTNNSLTSIEIEPSFNPILRAGYRIDDVRVGDVTDYDKLIISFETDGSVDPNYAVELAMTIIYHQLKLLLKSFQANRIHADEAVATTEGEAVQVEDDIDRSARKQTILQQPIEALDLPARALNGLRQDGIVLVSDLIKMTQSELIKTPNLGSKSITDIKKALQDNELSLAG